MVVTAFLLILLVGYFIRVARISAPAGMVYNASEKEVQSSPIEKQVCVIFDDGLDAYRDAVPVHWERWMCESDPDMDPADSLFGICYMRSALDENGGPAWEVYHRAYMSGTGEVIEVPGMENGTGYERQVAWTRNGYLYPTEKDGLWGFVSPSGEWKIEPLYLEVWPFREGYARVRLPDKHPFGGLRFAYIDPFGTIVVEWEYPDMVGPVRDGKMIRYRLENGEKTTIDIVDVYGNLLASGILIDADQGFLKTHYFHETAGESPYYRTHHYLSGQMLLEALDGRYGYFEETRYFSQGLMLASLDGKYGYLNEKGEWAVAPQYDSAGSFFEERAVVAQDGYYGYIDLDGELVIPMIYTDAWPFSEGKAAVQLNNDVDLEMAFIDKDGNTLFPGGYYGALVYAPPGSSPYIYRDGMCLVHRREGWDFINSAGEAAWSAQAAIRKAGVLPAPARDCQVYSFHNGLAAIHMGGEEWVINMNGEIICCAQGSVDPDQPVPNLW